MLGFSRLPLQILFVSMSPRFGVAVMSYEPIVTSFSLHAKQNNLNSGKTASDSQILACLRTILAMYRKIINYAGSY